MTRGAPEAHQEVSFEIICLINASQAQVFENLKGRKTHKETHTEPESYNRNLSIFPWLCVCFVCCVFFLPSGVAHGLIIWLETRTLETDRDRKSMCLSNMILPGLWVLIQGAFQRFDLKENQQSGKWWTWVSAERGDTVRSSIVIKGSAQSFDLNGPQDPTWLSTSCNLQSSDFFGSPVFFAHGLSDLIIVCLMQKKISKPVTCQGAIRSSEFVNFFLEVCPWDLQVGRNRNRGARLEEIQYLWYRSTEKLYSGSLPHSTGVKTWIITGVLAWESRFRIPALHAARVKNSSDDGDHRLKIKDTGPSLARRKSEKKGSFLSSRDQLQNSPPCTRKGWNTSIITWVVTWESKFRIPLARGKGAGLEWYGACQLKIKIRDTKLHAATVKYLSFFAVWKTRFILERATIPSTVMRVYPVARVAWEPWLSVVRKMKYIWVQEQGTPREFAN